MDNLNLKNILLAGGGVFIIFLLLFLVWNLSSKPKITQKIDLKISKNDWVKGAKSDDLILVEFSDFQCPACGSYYPIVKQLNEKNKAKLKFVYRHFPLSQHKNAEAAARASEAAGKQGKFFQFHDMLFEKQNEWSDDSKVLDTFLVYAKSLNIDLDKFKKDIESREVKNKVSQDQKMGIESGVNSTPTFFLNGVKIENPQSFAEFDKLVADEINKRD